MSDNILEDIVKNFGDIDTVSEYEVKQDGVCLISNHLYYLFRVGDKV